MKGPYVKIKIGIGVRWVSDKGMFPLIQCTEVSEMKSEEKKNHGIYVTGKKHWYLLPFPMLKVKSVFIS